MDELTEEQLRQAMRQLGARGGRARARSLTPARLSEIGASGGRASKGKPKKPHKRVNKPKPTKPDESVNIPDDD
jgi:general stress protein YciG